MKYRTLRKQSISSYWHSPLIFNLLEQESEPTTSYFDPSLLPPTEQIAFHDCPDLIFQQPVHKSLKQTFLSPYLVFNKSIFLINALYFDQILHNGHSFTRRRNLDYFALLISSSFLFFRFTK